MDKKAISPEMMVILLVFVIGAIILLLFSSALAGQLKENADVETCRLSVLAQAQTKTLGKSIVSLDCPRRNIKIFNDRVEINEKKSKKYEFKKLTEEEVNHILAEELRLCWYKMAEGNRDVFEQSYIFETEFNTCLICVEIEFDNKMKGNSYSGLLDYLKSRKIPKEDKSYFDYLTKAQSDFYLGYIPWTQWNPWFYGTSIKVTDTKIDVSQKYVIYFLAFKPAWLLQKTKAQTSAYYIGLGKEEKLKDECSILVN